jgi:general secretion pathway protein E
VLIVHSVSQDKNARDGDASDRLAEFFRQESVLEGTVIDRAERAARRTGERLDAVLAKLGLISENDLTAAMARFLRMPLIDEDGAPKSAILMDVIGPDFVRRHKLMPLHRENGQLVVGVTDPFNDEPLRAIAYAVDCPIAVHLFPPALFEKTFQSLYQTAADVPEELSLGSFDANDIDVERLRDLASEAPTIRLVNDLIAQAVEMKASDIHLEPKIDGLLLRYRVDGALLTARALAGSQKAPVTSRIKIMAGLDIAERRMPQDGRIKIAVRGNDIDFRVSTTPTAFGESVVLRILDRSQVELDLVKLGFSGALIQSLEKLLAEPNGIILVTGPTGSGKTTTLYTVLKALDRPDRKLFTVEDPIEYQLAGINQIQVHPDIGLSFPHALRSILRQDPDIIMIGEIRDVETAQIAIQASLTGHLVFSTLHTNSAAATITRLLDMGVESYLLASTIKAVLAQRLVRRLCRSCSIAHPEGAIWAEQIAARGTIGGQPNLRQASGCQACNGTGYSGRTTIAELLEFTAGIQSMVLSGAPDNEIDESARREGMIGMYDDGLCKAWRGETSLDEVLRATRVM